MRVLVVEDEIRMAVLLRRALEEEGHAVDVAADGPEGLWLATENAYGAIVLDVMLPGFDGIQLCRRLREAGIWVPVLMLTARDSVGDRVRGLDAGADDYLVKPFGVSELLARIRAVLRRVRPVGVVVRYGPLSMDFRTRKVTVSGAEVLLTPKEFDILECLATDPGRVQSRPDILASAWDANWYGPGKVLDVHIAALRRKLGVPGLIETVYGHGFRLGEV
jgi:two-component system, OmpR family, response regulator